MLDVVEILRLIDDYIARTGSNDAQISRAATGSSDTIRNWRRAARAGKPVGASTKTLEAVARVIDVDIAIQTDDEVIAEIQRLLPLAPESTRRAVLLALQSGSRPVESPAPDVNLENPPKPKRR